MRKRNKRMAGVKGKGYKGLENYSLGTAVKTIDILPALPYAQNTRASENFQRLFQ
jgi:hypothetical protein